MNKATSHGVTHNPFDGESSAALDARANSDLGFRRLRRASTVPSQVPPLQSGADDLTLDDVKGVIRTYRRLIVSCVLFFLILGVTYCSIAKRRYAATGQIEIEKTELSGLDSLGNPTGGPTNAAASDAVDFALTQPTQVKILESDGLALQVIRELDLERTADYFPLQASTGGPKFLSFLSKPLEPLSIPIDQAPNRRAVALKIFHKRLDVKPVAGTRLIGVTYYNPDPKLAASVVNHLLDDYANFEFEARLHDTSRAETWITQQLADLKKKTEELENSAIRLQRETGLFGEDEAHNIVTTRLDALNVEATSAESNRILKEAIYREVQSGDPELITGLNGNSLNGATALNQNSLTLLSSLRLQEESLRPQLEDYKSRYLPNHPKLIQLQAQFNDVESAIAQERGRIAARAKSDYQIALATELQAKQKLADQKSEATQLNAKTTAYALARQEADGSRGLYTGLLQKLRQTKLVEGLKANNVVVVDPGRIPSDNDPAKPRIPLILAVCVGAGLVSGVILMLWFYQRTLPYQGVAELGRDPGVSILGFLPETTPERRSLKRLVAGWVGLPLKSAPIARDPETAAQDPLYVDGILALRTSVVLGSRHTPQIIMTANASPENGPSYVGRNLSSALSNTGARTLYLDVDLQRSSFDSSGGNVVKLSRVMSRDGETADGNVAKFRTEPIDRSTSFLSGLDWLGSDHMRRMIQKWRDEYDHIVINVDAPLPATEAAIIATFADVALLVIQPGATKSRTFKALRRRVSEVLPPEARMGAVFEGVSKQTPEFAEIFGQPVPVGAR